MTESESEKVVAGTLRQAHVLGHVFPFAQRCRMPTTVVVLKATTGAPQETVRLPGIELRHEPERGRVVAHRGGQDIACFSAAEVERWSVEPD